MMSPKLANRIDELRRCRNVRDLRVIVLDRRGHRALVLVSPRPCEEGSTGADWEQTDEPFLMLIDSAVLLDAHGLH
jgi:hypothetical protein